MNPQEYLQVADFKYNKLVQESEKNQIVLEVDLGDQFAYLEFPQIFTQHGSRMTKS